MPFTTQFSLSLELAKILPLRSALTNGAEQLVNLVRALKRDGSDFLVEEDLAAIFGRGKIEPWLEKDFRDTVKVKDASFTPLYPDCQIHLDANPGATLGRAMGDRYYMSFIIQLSFLGWMHEETTLAATLAENMLTRYREGVKGATPDPDYDGILKTLQACSSQTSHYHWDDLTKSVENRFPRSVHYFRISQNPLRYLSPNLLLGAMDYFYMVQSLPEDRRIMVNNQFGLVPIIVWAHSILGLSVIVKDSPDGDVTFGSIESPQVVIKWSTRLLQDHNDVATQESYRDSAPTICLLDASLIVVLKTEPRENESSRIEGQECHRLKAYGTTLLQRLFNKTMLTPDNNPIYTEAANFAVAFSNQVANAMWRRPHADPRFYDSESDINFEIPIQCYLGTEQWRIFRSSRILFWGIELDKKTINEYSKELEGEHVRDMIVPSSIRHHLQTLTDSVYENVRNAFFDDMKQVASYILTFAQVVDVESCAELPLSMVSGQMFIPGVLQWEGPHPIVAESDAFLGLVMRMMKKYITPDRGRASEGLFLTSHQGWSLFYSSVGDYDPGQINCELMSIRRGVPTSSQTGERKYHIADAPPLERDLRTPVIKDRSESYLPRCVTKVVKRTEYYSSRSSEFWLSIQFDIEEAEENHRRGTHEVSGLSRRYSLYASHRQFHDALWGVIKTAPCRHRDEGMAPVPLDLGVKTGAGLTWANRLGEADESIRICICLVKGDSRARWLAVHGLMLSRGAGELNRQVLLRCEGCCADCAVKTVSPIPGDWLVIL